MDRRAFPRVSYSCPVRVELEVRGNEFRIDGFEAEGITINLGRGGMLARLSRRVAVGASCRISVFRCEGLLEPHVVRGTVLHSASGYAGDRGGWEVGVRFSEPLAYLVVPAGLQRSSTGNLESNA